MAYSRRPAKDPRTVARDIPGISEILFPQLTTGVVAHLNKKIRPCTGVKAVPDEMVRSSALKPAMLFEVGFARGEQILHGGERVDWDECLRVATMRQRRHFDARLPVSLTDVDMEVADRVGYNLACMLNQLLAEFPQSMLIQSPDIAGYQWLSASKGDFAIGTQLIEVKCTNGNFRSADYRQVLMYWLLSFGSSIEHDTIEWKSCVLLNPRLNGVLVLSFEEVIDLVTGGTAKVELLELFSFIVGEYGLREMSDLGL